jgi:hypothetical protein
MFAAIEEAHVPLAAWWVYTVKGWGTGMGAVNPQDPRFDYIADLIREANARIAGRPGEPGGLPPGRAGGGAH